MGLRTRPKRKPSSNKDDIYRILIGHWTRCTKAYADEKQRLYVATGILLSYISGSRLVSLFDTRVEVDNENGREGSSDGSLSVPAAISDHRAVKGNPNTLSRAGCSRRAKSQDAHPKAAPEIRHRNQPSILKKRNRSAAKEDRDRYGVKRPRIDTSRRTSRFTQDEVAGEDITYDAEDSDLGEYSDSDADFDLGYASEENDSSSSDTGEFAVSEPEGGTAIDTDTESITSFVDSGYHTTNDDDIDELDCYIDELDHSIGQIDTGELNRLVKEDRRKLNCFIDDVTDDEYDGGEEETATLLWRHIEFHIIRSPEEERPNILLAKITLLHTKGEDKKPRV
jgi:hypothetical protein